MTMGETKQRILMKLGDWGSVLLKRINHFYKNEEHCDLTLRLCSSETIKMHRMILHACTDYFDTILSPDTSSLDLDESFPAEVMILIVRFMYTGQVDTVNGSIYDELHKMAVILRMQILVDHLDAAKKQGHAKETRTASPPVEVLRPVVTNENSAPKRLSIWTRKTPAIAAVRKQNACNVPLVLSSNTMIRYVLTKPVPTRFEYQGLPPEDFPIAVVGDALNYMSHENDTPLVQPLVLDELTTTPSLPRISPGKRPREGSDLTNMKEFGQQQKIRNELMMEEDEEDVDDPAECPQNESTLKPILKSVQRIDPETPKRVRFQEGSQETKAIDQTYIPIATIPQPDLKVEKIEYAGSGELLVTSQYGKSEAPKRVQYSVLPVGGNDTVSESTSAVTSVDNPAKIVSEVLKKYPDLVTGRRKNIKLKVMSNAPSEGTSSSNASYIFIKDAGTAKNDYFHELNPENQAPWICTPCGKENGPLNFSIYEEFRKHITTVHNVKVSPKICEICGTKVTNLNHMAYHMYVKHKIEPPTKDLFPKCPRCSHISLSQNMLARHIDVVHGPAPLYCKKCNASYKSQALYKSHQCQTQTPNRRYRCPYCEDIFNQRYLLQDHIVSEHWESDEKTKKASTEPNEVKTDGETPSSRPDENNTQEQLSDETSNASQELEVAGVSQEEAEEEMEEEIEEDEEEEEEGEAEAEAEEGEEEVGVEEEIQAANVDKEPTVPTAIKSPTPDHTEEKVPEETEAVVEETVNDQRPEAEEIPTNEPITNENLTSEMEVIEEKSKTNETETFETTEEASSEETPVAENTELCDNDPELPDMEISMEGKSNDGEIEQEKIGFTSDTANNESYEAMEIEETASNEDMKTDLEETPVEAESAQEVQQETENREGQGDHDYAPYNSMVMFQPNVVLPPRVMLVTHPIAHPLQVFMPAPNIITDQIVLPYPQCTQMQVVNNGQVVPTTAQVVTSTVPTECVQVVRERKIEPETLANDWDESNQAETPTPPVLPPGVGPSRAEFF